MSAPVHLRVRAPGTLFVLALVACGPADAGREPVRPPPLPAPLSHADTTQLGAALDRAAQLDPLNSLLILHRDSLVTEAYFRGMRADRPVNVKSVSKTLLSPLVGIAMRDSLLPGIDTPLPALFPEHFDGDEDPVKQSATLHHVLSMTTGIEGTSFRNYGPWVTSSNWVRFALEQPAVCTPGRCMTYSTGNSHLVSVLLTRAVGGDLLAWADEVLYGALDVRLRPWDRDPQGNLLGGNNMHLTPRELLAFGRLYLDSGRVDGRQVVPRDWIERSWGSYGRSRWNGHHYGYLWWTRRVGGETVHFAWGYGGQFVFVVPRLDLAVVVTSSLTDRPRGVRHNPRVYDLLGCRIIPAFREGTPDPGCHWRRGTFRAD